MNTTETCLTTFFAALAARDLGVARSCVLDAKPSSQVDEILLQFPDVEVTEVRISRDGDTSAPSFLIDARQAEPVAQRPVVSAPVGIECRPVLKGSPVVDPPRLSPWHIRLRCVDDSCYLSLERSADDLIAAIAADLDHSERSRDPMLAWLVYPDRFDDLMAASRSSAKVHCCQGNVRILSGRVAYAVHSLHLELTEENWREQIRPHIPKHPDESYDFFTCPVTGEGYSLNLPVPPDGGPGVPIVYEGQGRELSFVHNGKAAVGFCLGDSRFIGPEDPIRWP